MTFYEKAKIFFESENLDIYFSFDLKWASTYSEHRIKLRKQLYKYTKNKSVLDLTKRPNLPDQSISISHCPKIGGFVVSKKNIGLDLEQYQRLSQNLIKRISDNSEHKYFDDESYQIIWTIKEAVFKASQGKVKVISDIKVLNNQKNQPNLEETQNIEAFKISDLIYFKSEAEVQNLKFKVYSMVSKCDDICLSVAFEI